MRFHLYISFTMFCVHSFFFLFFFSLCLFDVQLVFLNTCQKMINGVGWLDDRHGLSPQRPSLFTLINYCAIVFSFALMFANGWLTALWCFCLLAESYETIKHWPLIAKNLMKIFIKAFEMLERSKETLEKLKQTVASHSCYLENIQRQWLSVRNFASNFAITISIINHVSGDAQFIGGIR